MSLPELDPQDQRVLGVLLEKQLTVPATYPMTLAAVRTGCNQASSRDPVTDHDETTVEATLKRLRDLELVRIVWADTGRRTLKYHQVADAVLQIDPAQRAVLTVLLLRGPQAPGALRSRTERLYGFADRGEVASVLAGLATRTEPLVRELPRQRGQQDARWAHLLGPLPEAADDPAAASEVTVVDRESVLAAGASGRDERVRRAYATVATAYAAALLDELADLPFERWLLDRVAAQADGAAVVEVGSGPGHVTAYLAAAGAAALGLDLCAEMVAEARRRFPDGHYEVGDLRRLMRPPAAPGWTAVLAWYSLIHLATSELAAAVAALVRPLAPGGWLVIALHVGEQVRHVDTWFAHEVDLDIVLHDRLAVLAAVTAAGLIDIEWYLRGPSAARGEYAERLYVVARRA